MKRKAKVDERIGLAEQRRNVAGIDLAGHADHYVCGPRLDGGTPNVRHFGTTTSELERMACWLAEQNVVSVAMESTSVYWIPACDLLESRVFEVVLFDTREVRMEARTPPRLVTRHCRARAIVAITGSRRS